jgi:hypothetical protein
MSKASGAYKNSSWDLVDGLEDGSVDLAKTEELPEEMKAMTLEQRKAHVAAAAGKRKELQARIRALSAERETFVQEEAKRQGLEAGNTLDAALLRAVRVQAEKSGYAFKK